ncbi:MAG: putative membrane-bound redox modulator Alx [Elusimicrobia bacterium]|nr:putative membrane-bound redox modulator Alx [Elusimicrobiota bacterium]
MNGPLMWVGFIALILILLALDLFVFHRKAHEIKFKEALLLSVFWIAVALLFNVGLYFYEGKVKAMEFLAGYLIEKSLSVDNLFVFIVIFSYYKVEATYQHKILFWGIVGALVMRAVFILAGVTLIHKFEWMTYIFGFFLVYTGFKMAFAGDSEMDPSKTLVLKVAKKFLPMADYHDKGSFFVKHHGKWMVTPLFIVLLIVETTDVVFAVDSIPAILSISTDSFIVFSSNVFAILGLRALYFALAGVMKMFRYLKIGLSIILAFVGVKMIITHYHKFSIGTSLGVVMGVLLLSILASLAFPKKASHNPAKY